MGKYLCEEDMNTGEYIRRDDTLKAIHQYCKDCDNYNGVMCRACEYADDMDIICAIPAEDVQPVKRGEWEKKSTVGVFRCSLCQHIFMLGADEIDEYHFCPNCGADMREGE